MAYKFPVDGNFEDVLKAALPEILYTCDFDLSLPENAAIKYIWENLPVERKRIYQQGAMVVIEAFAPNDLGYRITLSRELAFYMDFAPRVVEKMMSELHLS